ncbi:hypothetical protein M5K25_003781 [Dendrobium thyrsiflorum]|uniref:Uncharacterized protein n=1 Tax=Dendrobium thyrsiflorum TaxID=117978 RepID=A0ABD0VJZ0_DENTH
MAADKDPSVSCKEPAEPLTVDEIADRCHEPEQEASAEITKIVAEIWDFSKNKSGICINSFGKSIGKLNNRAEEPETDATDGNVGEGRRELPAVAEPPSSSLNATLETFTQMMTTMTQMLKNIQAPASGSGGGPIGGSSSGPSLGFPLDVSVPCMAARFSVLTPLGFPRFSLWLAAFGGGGLGFCAAFWGPVFWALRFSLSLQEPSLFPIFWLLYRGLFGCCLVGFWPSPFPSPIGFYGRLVVVYFPLPLLYNVPIWRRNGWLILFSSSRLLTSFFYTQVTIPSVSFFSKVSKQRLVVGKVLGWRKRLGSKVLWWTIRFAISKLFFLFDDTSEGVFGLF